MYVAEWPWERSFCSRRWSYSGLSANLIHHAALARDAGRANLSPFHLGGPEGVHSSSCQPRANGRMSGERATQRHPDSLLCSSQIPLHQPPWQGSSRKEVWRTRGQENTEVKSKVTNLIKPSQIKYCLCRRVHLPACLGSRKRRFSVLWPDKRLQAS